MLDNVTEVESMATWQFSNIICFGFYRRLVWTKRFYWMGLVLAKLRWLKISQRQWEAIWQTSFGFGPDLPAENEGFDNKTDSNDSTLGSFIRHGVTARYYRHWKLKTIGFGGTNWAWHPKVFWKVWMPFWIIEAKQSSPNRIKRSNWAKKHSNMRIAKSTSTRWWRMESFTSIVSESIHESVPTETFSH